MKKITLFILLILLCTNYIQSTPQAGDRLIYKGDTISIYPFILEQYILDSPDKEIINKQIQKSLQVSTGCWRGYRSLFEIRNDSLFLLKAYGAEDFDLSLIFGRKTNIFVDWYSGTLISPKNCLIYEHEGWGGFYEYETDLKFENGILKNIQSHHNEIKPSVYTNSNTLMNYIKTNINYDNIKAVSYKIRVTIRIDDVDNNGKITKLSVLRGYDDYNNEAVRVIKSIPQWQVIIRRGNKEHIPWIVPVIFEAKD